jgi:hypothetical protein
VFSKFGLYTTIYTSMCHIWIVYDHLYEYVARLDCIQPFWGAHTASVVLYHIHSLVYSLVRKVSILLSLF